MNATIISFRRGRHSQKNRQYLLEVAGVNSRAKAAPFIGQRVTWIAPVKARDKKAKEIRGTITAVHGSNGVLRARFTRGLPGTAITQHVALTRKNSAEKAKEKK